MWQPLSYAGSHCGRFLTELQDFVRFPSVSAQPNHADDVKRCAAWLGAHLCRIGLKHVKVVPTPWHPIVYAEWQHAPGRPSVLTRGRKQRVNPCGRSITL
jgi:acetylornithine deacetylase/succinyl-diaminopimelate desuccinylase-like protein